MLRIDAYYIALAALYLVVGVALGIGMGIAHDFRYAPVHAHVNLIGWTTHGLMGLALAFWPAMARSRLALTQFVVFAVSSPVFLGGLVLAVGFDQPLVAIIGSLGLFVGVLLFAAMAVGALSRGRIAAPAPRAAAAE